MQHQLAHELSHYQYLRDQLAAQFPEADEETLLDTLEGMTDLHEMVATVIRARMDDITLITALKSRISAMHDRLSRIEHRAETMKDVVVSVMDRAGIRKIAEADFTLTLRPTNPPLEIINEGLIPDKFWKHPAPRLDRAGLIGALKEGNSVPGAALGNGGLTISVRSR